MRRLHPLPLLASFALLALVVAPVNAQYPSGGMGGRMGGGMGGGMGRGGMMGRPGRMNLPTPDEIEGPPTPAAMDQVVTFHDNQADEYAQAYTAHMDSTQQVRDSLRSTMQAMRGSFQRHDRGAAHAQAEAVQHSWKELSKQDKEFEKALKNILDKDQLKQYKQWRDDQQKAAEQERRDRMRQQFGGRS